VLVVPVQFCAAAGSADVSRTAIATGAAKAVAPSKAARRRGGSRRGDPAEGQDTAKP